MDVPFSQQLRRERKRRGWSQLDVAERIGIDTKTVQRWERGKILPQPYYQQALCTLFEKSVEEFGLLTGRDSVEQVIPPSIDAGAQKAPPQEGWRTDTKDPAMFLETFLEDWGESPSLERFYGRERELEITRGWICEESCRLVALVGMGGIGKTAFTAHLIGQIKGSFSQPFEKYMQRALLYLREKRPGLCPLPPR